MFRRCSCLRLHICNDTFSFSHPPLFIHTYVFFFNTTATTEIYTLSLHDALPILRRGAARHAAGGARRVAGGPGLVAGTQDRKSTRLNSSHVKISYAVFCLKKKKLKIREEHRADVDEQAVIAAAHFQAGKAGLWFGDAGDHAPAPRLHFRRRPRPCLRPPAL